MKQKLYIYVTNAEKAVQGEQVHLHADTYGELTVEGWVMIGESEVEVEVNIDDLRASAVKTIDAEESKLRAQLHTCETRKQNLLALTHQAVA